jgi:uncharacterized Zn-binding protein involved in type VI secretion
MKDAKGRGVIRLGDTTSHGGTVITASTTLEALGREVAVDGDLTVCPRCKGKFPINVNQSDRQHHGKRSPTTETPPRAEPR